MSRSVFRCIAGCAGDHPLDEVIYKCPKCGDLLEVVHDIEALKSRSAASWIKLFDERYQRTTWPYGSGVWGKKEWVQPHIADENVVSMMEGGTNLLWAERYGKSIGLPELWVKQCGVSHTGSFKDLGMTVLVSTVKQMIADGKPIQAVACASTGDTSAALAAYAAAAGIRAMVILPRGKISTAQLVQPLANGAVVLAVDGDFDGCMAMVQRLAEEEGVYLANSMNSLRVEGQKTVSIEMVQQFDWGVPDWVVIPGGNLGNVSALGAGFTMMHELGLIQKLPRICVAQAAAANPLYRAYKAGWDTFEPLTAKPTLASAIQIGNPVSVKKAIRTLEKFDGVVEQATEAELADAAARRRSHRAVQLPAHRRGAGGAGEAGGARRDPRDRPGRGGLHRQRPQVHRLQGALPRGRASRGAEPEIRQPPGPAAQRLRGRPRYGPAVARFVTVRGRR